MRHVWVKQLGGMLKEVEKSHIFKQVVCMPWHNNQWTGSFQRRMSAINPEAGQKHSRSASALPKLAASLSGHHCRWQPCCHNFFVRGQGPSAYNLISHPERRLTWTLKPLVGRGKSSSLGPGRQGLCQFSRVYSSPKCPFRRPRALMETYM